MSSTRYSTAPSHPSIVDGDVAQIGFISDDEMRPGQHRAILERLGRIKDAEHRTRLR